MVMEVNMSAYVRRAPDKKRMPVKARRTFVIAEQSARLWRETNQAALESSNAYVDQHGLPLAKYRSF
jgi:post-segregation antitoxin (ccd killing protein)